MIEEFLYKLNNNLYISNYLFTNIKESHSEVIPVDFNIDKYNERVLDKMYEENKIYFDNMFNEVDPNIHIDNEQAKAILADEDYSLILAGAGTGKTTTMAAKVKYLVDKKHVNPTDIVVLSFTKKTTEEIRKRIVDDFNIPANVFTFHSLGYKYIRNYYQDRKIFIVEDNYRNKIFEFYMRDKVFSDNNKLRQLASIYINNEFNPMEGNKPWILGKFLANNYYNFNSFDEYFKAYKENCIKEAGDKLREKIYRTINKRMNEDTPRTLKGELVKSIGEARIANFLFVNGIDYKYEKVYKELIEDRKEYRPDFTINYAGEEIYIEYFGLSNYEGEEVKEYQKIKKIKEEYHYNRHNKFIKIDYVKGENIINTLRVELTKLGIELKERSEIEIYNDILDQNPTREMYKLKSLWYEIIDTIKASNKREQKDKVIKEYLDNMDYSTKLNYEANSYFVLDFYNYYDAILTSNKTIFGIDYNDMIYYASNCLEDPTKFPFNYKYLIIDEYQDISQGRYLLTKGIIDSNHGKIVAVGDDWQSIYGFSGSKIEYVYNFDKYYKGAKIFRISTTYRNSQSLVNYAGEFIMRNKSQIPKDLISVNEELNPIVFVPFEDHYEYEKLKELIFEIDKYHPGHHILILARKNYAIDKIFEDTDFKDDIGTRISVRNINDITIDGMSIHRSKGLTADDVIVIGLNDHFPIEGYSDNWLIDLFKNEVVKEQIDDAEERRVFYVALTRTKNKVYLLVNNDLNKVSPFVKELKGIILNDQNKEPIES